MDSGQLKRILYVEDDLSIQAVAQMALEELGGFVLQVCSSGREALAAAAAFKPDLLLLDVMMPDMDGMQTLDRLRELEVTAHTPAIFMTARAQPHEVAEYMALGALGVIPKPFEPMLVSDQLRGMWEQAERKHG